MKNRANQAFALAVVAVIVAVAALIYVKATDERGKHLVAWNVYTGTLQTTTTYRVEISEEDNGYGFERLVHLWPANKPTYESITGHDYNSDGKWDRVFYCGKHDLVNSWTSGSLGCNSVFRTRDGWKFEPCPADKGNVMPFSETAIQFAIKELDTAMSQFYKKEHLVRQWKWDAKQKKAIEIFNRT